MSLLFLYDIQILVYDLYCVDVTTGVNSSEHTTVQPIKVVTIDSVTGIHNDMRYALPSDAFKFNFWKNQIVFFSSLFPSS
jgi:hypothetical protein